MSVELEVAGERVVVENWPEHFPEPPGPVDVNGERWTVTIERGTETGLPVAPPSRAIPHPDPVPTPLARPGTGTPVLPPMPGKVIEVRVKEGERVRKGEVLLVLEAMKMRNEITSPMDGVVRGLAVGAGANARAKEPMLYLAPD
ncbi:MAG: biotin/lipoyl-containing protein [Thermoplasmata archaeon]